MRLGKTAVKRSTVGLECAWRGNFYYRGTNFCSPGQKRVPREQKFVRVALFLPRAVVFFAGLSNVYHPRRSFLFPPDKYLSEANKNLSRETKFSVAELERAPIEVFAARVEQRSAPRDKSQPKQGRVRSGEIAAWFTPYETVNL
jgi:hypothetical protein